MNFNDLLKNKGIDPEKVLAFRHRPTEATLNKVLPWIAAEKPDLFNAYQQTQGEKLLEKVMERMKHAPQFYRTPAKTLWRSSFANEKLDLLLASFFLCSSFR